MKIRNGFVANSSSSSFILSANLSSFEAFIISLGFTNESLDLIVCDHVGSDDCIPNDDEVVYLDHETNSVTWKEVLREIYNAGIKSSKISSVREALDKVGICNYIGPFTGISIMINSFDFQTIYAKDLPAVLELLREVVSNSEEGELINDLTTAVSVLNENAVRLAITYLLKEKDKDVFVIEFSDKCSDMEGFMEHGRFWRMINHVQVSHH